MSHLNFLQLYLYTAAFLSSPRTWLQHAALLLAFSMEVWRGTPVGELALIQLERPALMRTVGTILHMTTHSAMHWRPLHANRKTGLTSSSILCCIWKWTSTVWGYESEKLHLYRGKVKWCYRVLSWKKSFKWVFKLEFLNVYIFFIKLYI